MVNTYISLFAGLANIIAILLVYYSLGKELEKSKKLIDTMITIGIMYIVILIVYTLSGLGIDVSSINSIVKTYMMMAFVPVNTILLAPFLIHSYMNVKNKKLDIDRLNKRAIIVGVMAIIIIIIEFFYFRNFQKHIVATLQEQNNYNNEMISENAEENNQTENQLNNVYDYNIVINNNIRK